MSFDKAQFTRTYDLAYAVVGDEVRIEQGGADFSEPSIVDLHKSQVALLATELGLIQGGPDAWDRVKTLERRFLKLRLKLLDLEGVVRSHPIFGGSSKDDDELQAVLAILDLVDEWCEDLTFFELTPPAEDHAESRDVTPSHVAQGLAGDGHGKPTGSPRKPRRASQGALPLEAEQ